MSRYIKRDDIYALFGKSGIANLHVADIDVIQDADVVSVVHGRWVKTNYFDVHFCSCCDKATNTRLGLPNYCPHCGANMRGDSDG